MRSVLALAVVLFSVSQAQAAACPLGAKDTELTIQRVMINFGKFTAKADSAVAMGLSDVSAVSDAELSAAAQDLGVAEACAEAVVQGESDALLPASVKRLAGADRDQYVTAFRQAMLMFAGALTDYAQSLSDLAPMPTKDFAMAARQKKIVSDMADEAHSRFAN